MIIFVSKQDDGTYGVEDGRRLIKSGFSRARDAMRWVEASGLRSDEDLEEIGLPLSPEELGNFMRSQTGKAIHISVIPIDALKTEETA
jgi:hypothetical protein